MAEDDPHTADLVDEDPDQRRAPRPTSEGVHELEPQSGSRCQTMRTVGASDTPGVSDRRSPIVGYLVAFLRNEADELDRVAGDLPPMSGYENRLRGVARRLRREADEFDPR